MKVIIPFIVALGFVSLAIAQEESPSPSTEESASATVQESPAEAITSTPAPTAAAAATPMAKKKEAAPAASPAAQKPMAEAKPGKKMSVEATLKDNENRWESAVSSHDSSVAQAMVASDFMGVYWDGKVVNKSALIGMGKKDKDTYKSAVNEKLAVHSYGPTVAVVVGTAHEKGTEKDGKAFDHVYRFTDTWVDRGGQWQCVASQISRLK